MKKKKSVAQKKSTEQEIPFVGYKQYVESPAYKEYVREQGQEPEEEDVQFVKPKRKLNVTALVVAMFAFLICIGVIVSCFMRADFVITFGTSNSETNGVKNVVSVLLGKASWGGPTDICQTALFCLFCLMSLLAWITGLATCVGKSVKLLRIESGIALLSILLVSVLVLVQKAEPSLGLSVEIALSAAMFLSSLAKKDKKKARS